MKPGPMRHENPICPSSIREAAELGYEVEDNDGDALIAGGQFISQNEMIWEGEMTLAVYLENPGEEQTDLVPIRVRAKAHYTFEIIQAE